VLHTRRSRLVGLQPGKSGKKRQPSTCHWRRSRSPHPPSRTSSSTQAGSRFTTLAVFMFDRTTAPETLCPGQAPSRKLAAADQQQTRAYAGHARGDSAEGDHRPQGEQLASFPRTTHPICRGRGRMNARNPGRTNTLHSRGPREHKDIVSFACEGKASVTPSIASQYRPAYPTRSTPQTHEARAGLPEDCLYPCGP
jgi:hypothetical protein